jgi:hypothetical protein
MQLPLEAELPDVNGCPSAAGTRIVDKILTNLDFLMGQLRGIMGISIRAKRQ